jgi:hypothetical protein
MKWIIINTSSCCSSILTIGSIVIFIIIVYLLHFIFAISSDDLYISLVSHYSGIVLMTSGCSVAALRSCFAFCNDPDRGQRAAKLMLYTEMQATAESAGGREEGMEGLVTVIGEGQG